MLLILTAVLAPIMGGQLSLGAMGITSSAQVFSSIFGGIEAPMIGHAVLALLPCAALVTLFLGRRVLQVPNTWISGGVILFLVTLVASILMSQFRSDSIQALLEWLSYGIVFYACIAGVGRQRGPMLMMAGTVLGCTLVALYGITEYGQMKAQDPAWRIFSVYVNPNALAAMLLIGFFLALGLLVTRKGLESLAAGVGALAMVLALLLTQSKGALLCLVVGGIVFAVLALVWARAERKAVLMRVGSVLGACVLLVVVMQLQAKAAASGGALSHVTNAAATSEQSGTYRLYLWKSALALTKENPAGYGLGTFRYFSSKPGLTSQTHLAHESYLQLMAEASPIALVLLIAIAGLWFFQMLRGARALPSEQNLLRAAVIAAVVAIGAHNLIDSDFYYYGIGLTTFMLLGVGLLLAADAVAPENVPVTARRLGAAGAAAISVGMLYYGYLDIAQAELRGAVAARDIAAVKSAYDALQAVAGADGDAYAALAIGSLDDADRTANLERAVELSPSTKNLRALAQNRAQRGKPEDAATLYRRALALDPNNLQSLNQLYSLQQGALHDPDGARKTLERLIAVEETPYFKVRAIPELVPTETYQARIALANLSTNPDERIKLIAPAVDGFRQYLSATLPSIKNAEKEGLDGNFGGERVDQAKEKMELAASAADDLAKLYRAAGNAAGAKKAEDDAIAFRSAFGDK